MDTETPRILRFPEVVARVGLRKSAIYAEMARGSFPRPVRLTRRTVGWHEATIARWIAERPMR